MLISSKSKILIAIICLCVFFLLIVPVVLMWFFMGKDAWFIIKFIAIIIGLSIILIPVYTLAGLARSGAPVPIASFINSVARQIKEGVLSLFKNHQ